LGGRRRAGGADARERGRTGSQGGAASRADAVGWLLENAGGCAYHFPALPAASAAVVFSCLCTIPALGRATGLRSSGAPPAYTLCRCAQKPETARWLYTRGALLSARSWRVRAKGLTAVSVHAGNDAHSPFITRAVRTSARGTRTNYGLRDMLSASAQAKTKAQRPIRARGRPGRGRRRRRRCGAGRLVCSRTVKSLYRDEGSGLVRTRASVRGSTSYPHGCRDLAVRVLTSCEL